MNRPFDSWCVLGRTGGDFPDIRFSDLGLDSKLEYVVFEFWGKKFLGTFTGGFPPAIEMRDTDLKSSAFVSFNLILSLSRRVGTLLAVVSIFRHSIGMVNG